MKIPVFICMLIVAVVLAFIVGLMFGNYLPGNSFGQDSLSAWVSASSSAVVGVLTIVLAVETWRLRAVQSKQLDDLRRESIRPSISVELVPNRVGVNFMDVVVHNYGKGIARKVKFEFLDREGRLIAITEDPVILSFRKLGIFTLGLESMGVGHEFRAFLFSFLELSAKVEGNIFGFFLTVRVTFQDVEQHIYSEDFIIDFNQYKGLGTLGEDPLNQIAKELKSIKDLLPRPQNGRMQIDVFDSTDRHEGDDAGYLRLAEMRGRRNREDEST